MGEVFPLFFGPVEMLVGDVMFLQKCNQMLALCIVEVWFTGHYKDGWKGNMECGILKAGV